MRAGWIVAGLGVFTAVIFRHADAIAFGVMLVVLGLLMLKLKGV